MFVELLQPFCGKPAGERLYVPAEEAQGLLRAGVARAVTDDPLAPVIARGLESPLAGWAKGLDALVNQTLRRVAEAQGQGRRVAVPALFGAGGDGDPRKSFGDWCLAVARNDRGYLEKHYGSQFNPWKQKAALGESSGVAGGYTVPPEFYQQLMTIMAEESFIRPRWPNHRFRTKSPGARWANGPRNGQAAYHREAPQGEKVCEARGISFEGGPFTPCERASEFIVSGGQGVCEGC